MSAEFTAKQYAALFASADEIIERARRIKKVLTTHEPELEPHDAWALGKRIAADFLRRKVETTDTSVIAAYENILVEAAQYEVTRIRRITEALAVGVQLKELAPDLRDESFDDVAALVAFELEQQALDISDLTIKAILDDLRRRQPRHFITDEARGVLMALTAFVTLLKEALQLRH
ncbi:MAG TPA: hypothetical protein VGH23_16470 [Rhizomicrobium sp.]|jgi:hypothetical protein